MGFFKTKKASETNLIHTIDNISKGSIDMDEVVLSCNRKQRTIRVEVKKRCPYQHKGGLFAAWENVNIEHGSLINSDVYLCSIITRLAEIVKDEIRRSDFKPKEETLSK